MSKGERGDNLGYYPSRIFVYSLLYCSLNALDFIITTLALEHHSQVWELNPFHYYPVFALFKPVIPMTVLALLFILYLVNRSWHSRILVGKYGLGCMMLLAFFYELICLNNLIVVYLAQ